MTSSNSMQGSDCPTQAAEWYVRHESEDGMSALECQRWQEWVAEPENGVKHDELVALHRRIASLPRPSLPSARDVCADIDLSQVSLDSFWQVVRRHLKYSASQQAILACCGVLILAGVFGSWFLKHHVADPSTAMAASTDGAQGVPFSESTLELFRASGRPVFVNLRASWCPTCTANERNVIARDPVQQMMTRKHIAYLTGDWSLQDSAISAELRRFGRNGVPLYLLFSPGSKEPLIFPQVLTERVVLQELSRLPEPRVSSSPSPKRPS